MFKMRIMELYAQNLWADSGPGQHQNFELRMLGAYAFCQMFLAF